MRRSAGVALYSAEGKDDWKGTSRVCVCLRVCCLSHTLPLLQFHVTDEDVFCTLFASAVHDYNHPGINNSFHVKTQNYLAVMWNDRSVNENIHASSVFEIMRLEQFDVWQEARRRTSEHYATHTPHAADPRGVRQGNEEVTAQDYCGACPRHRHGPPRPDPR